MSDTDAEFVERLTQDFKEVKFKQGARRFSCQLRGSVFVIFLGPPCPKYGLLTLHELGHALSKHKDYTVDVQRVKIESEAWERAKTVYLKYANEGKISLKNKNNKVKDKAKIAELLPEWDEDFVQEKLDTYRDWLHTKSRCKKCGLTCYQTEDGVYRCPRCESFGV